jgi:hypothetical protein
LEDFMPIVQPDYRGDTRVLSVSVAADLLLQTVAYATQCHATLDNVVGVALGRLLDADKTEREAWLHEHRDALEPSRLKPFARGANGRGRSRRRRASTAAPARTTAPSATPGAPTAAQAQPPKKA